MNVTLPNGVVVTGVPDDITQTDLARIAVDNGLASADVFGDLLQDTTFLGSVGEFGKRALGGVATGAVSTVTGLGQLIPGLDDEALVEADMSFREGVAETLGYDPAYDENYGAQLGQVVGEMVPMVASALYTGPLSLLARTAAVTGPALSEGSFDRKEFEDRTGEKLSDYERLASKGADVALGQLERFGIPARFIKGLPSGFFKTDNPIVERISSMVAGGLREGVQEVGQGIARDISTLAIYDPDRKIADSAVEDFTLGGGAGAIFDLAVGLAQSPLRRRGARTPDEIGDLTPEQVEAEEQARAKFDAKEQERRARIDNTLGLTDIGPQPEVRPDPIDPTAVDPSLPVEEMADQVVTRLGSRLPIAATFTVGSADNKFYAEVDGEQVGPALEDPLVVQELANRLTETSRRLGKDAEVEYIVENSGLEYTEQQAAEAKSLGRAIPSPQERIIRAEDANEAVGRDIASVINNQRVDRGEAETEVFTLEEVRAANKGDVGRLGDVLAEKDADFLAFRNDQPVQQAPLSPTQPRQPALGRRQQALSALSASFDNEISSERAFADLFAAKRMDLSVNSEAFRGLVKRIIGKTPSKKNPLDNLSANERRYLYHRIRKLPSFQEKATQIPDFSVKTPDGELVRIARRQIEVGQPSRLAVEAASFGQTGQIPSQAEVRRVEGEARRTAQPLERGGQQVPEGQQVVEYDPDTSALGQQLRDMLKTFGIDDTFATKMVDAVGKARRDTAGNIYVDFDPNARDARGSAQYGAKLIQVSMDQVRRDVAERGLSYDQAVAEVMSHEIVHAMRAMDLFTPQEWSLLERLSRKQSKVGEAGNISYANWAVKTYEGLSEKGDAVAVQEEAIAELISDMLTGKLKLGGKPRNFVQKIADFFKKILGFAEKNDIQSFEQLVNDIQSGVVGRRERGVVRTAFRTERQGRQVEERLITIQDLSTTIDGLPAKFRSGLQRAESDLQGQGLQDAPILIDDELLDGDQVDEAAFSRRLEAAEEQGFDISTVYYHGTGTRNRPVFLPGDGPFSTITRTINGVERELVVYTEAEKSRQVIIQEPPIDKFDPSRRAEEHIDMPLAFGLIAGHFTESPAFAAKFAKMDKLGVKKRDKDRPSSTIYPVYLRFGEDNSQGGLFAYHEADRDGALQVLLDIVEAPLKSSPGLMRDMSSYYAMEINALIKNPSRSSLKATTMSGPKLFEQVLSGDLSVDAAARQLAEIYHRRQAPIDLETLIEEPDAIGFGELERMAPYIKEAGYVGYRDIEYDGGPYTGIAMFNPGDIKGIFAKFDPASVPEGAAYDDDIMYSRRSDAGGRSARDMFSGTSSAMFNPRTGEVDYGLRDASRSIVVDMPIDMFLHLAAEGGRPGSAELVRGVAETGEKFDMIPLLRMTFEPGKPEDRYVYDHDGRHRARQLKSMGYDTVPVMVEDVSIRWDRQAKDHPDRVAVWPERITDQNENTVFPMFISRDAEVRYGRFGPQDDIMYSRRAKPAEVDVVDIMSGAEQAPKMRFKKQVATFLQNRTLDQTGAPRSFAIEEDREAIATDLAKEAVYEYNRADSAIEWYDQTIANTIEMLSVVYPEIKKDKGSRAMFLASLAITSQNLAVPDNLALAEKSYKHYKENGKFKVQGSGDKKKSMEANFKKLNMLLEQMSPAEIADFLETKFVVRKLNKLSAQLLGKEADTGELVDNEVYGSAIFGPKIGNGFYSNLRGDFSPITMDMWFMRTMGRLSGTLIGVSRANLREAQERFAKATGKKRIYADKLLEEAREVKSAHERMYKNMTAAQRKKFKKPEKTLAAENLIKKVDGTNDVPRNGSERNQLRDITRRAMAKFEEATGVSIEPAAFQALIWYPEQDLYKSLGVKLKHVRQDYATATEQHLTKLGVDPRELKRAKDRVRRSAERGAGAVRSDPRGDVGRPDAKSNYSAREGVSQKRSVATQQEIDQAVEANLQEVNTTQGPPRFSTKASPEAQYIARNPGKGLDEDTPAYSRVRSSSEAEAVMDRITRGPDQEAPPGKVFMAATDTGPIGATLTRLKAAAIDRYAALGKYYQKIPGLRELEADSSAIAAALFSDRSKGILASAVKYGVPVYRGGLTKVEEFTHKGKTYRGLIGVMSLIHNKEVGDLRKQAQAYAMAIRSQELRSQGKQTPVSPQDAQIILRDVDQFTDANGYNPIKEWHDVWQAYNSKTIDFLKATGILNEETADIWKDSSYIPFYRSGEDQSLPTPAKNVFGDMTRMSEFKAYKGSEKGVDVGLVESVILNLSAAVEMGMKNVAQQRIARDMQSLGLARQVNRKAKINNGIKFKVDGKEVHFEIDDNLIFDSMVSLSDGLGVNFITKYLGMPANALRELITRDPGFMVANIFRDTMSTFVTSGANFVPIVDSVKGLAEPIENLEKLGVVGGYDFAIDNKDIVKFYQEESKRRGVNGMPLNMFTTIWNALGRATTASDAATRNAVYKDVLARTGNEAEAAFQAMEIINFSRRGAHPLARILTATIPFLNARFQGLDVFGRALTGNYSTNKKLTPGQIQFKFLTRGAMLAGLTAMYYTLVSDDEQYKEQSDEVRENNWIIPTDAGVPVKLPIPFEVGLLYKVLPEVMLDTLYGDRSKREAREALQRGIMSTLEINPFGMQFAAPFIEAWLNHSFFTGRPVVPVYLNQSGSMTPGLVDRLGVTELSKDIGEKLNINPIKIDHVIHGYVGTLGGYGIAVADAMYKTLTIDSDKERPPSRNVFEFPLWRRFFGSKEGSGLRTDAYELYNDVKEVVSTINDLKKDGRVEELEAYLAARQHILALKSPVYAIKRQLDRARAEKRRIENADIDPDLKRQMRDDIDAKINEYLTIIPKLKELRDAPFIQGTY